MLSDLSIPTVNDAGTAPKCLLIHDDFDWETDSPPNRPASDLVIYETHVRGFTIHPSPGVAHPGTGFFLLFDPDSTSVDFAVSALPADKIWCLAVDTFRNAPDDLFEAVHKPSMRGQIGFRVEPRPSAILLTEESAVPREN